MALNGHHECPLATSSFDGRRARRNPCIRRNAFAGEVVPALSYSENTAAHTVCIAPSP